VIAAQESPRLTQGPLSPAVLARMLLEAVIAIGALGLSAQYFAVPFDGPYIILSLLVFSLTFPGHAPRGTSPAAIARDVLGGWILVVGLLLMLGWATRTIGSFDERVIVAWVAVTPVAMFVGHMLVPLVLPQNFPVFHRVAYSLFWGNFALIFDARTKDRRTPIEPQLQWLREVGFEDADVWFKESSFAVMTGTKE